MADILLENPYLTACEERGEPTWLLERRRAAWAKSQDLVLPHLERTDITRWKLEAAVPGLQPAWDSVTAKGGKASGTLVVANGRGVRQDLSPALRAQGVVLLPLDEALPTLGEKLRPYLLAKEPPDENLLTALHRTYLNGGAVLFVPRGVEVEAPFEIVHVLGQADAYPHTLVILEEMARATVVETFTSADDVAVRVNAALDAHVGQGAFLRFAGIQKLSEKASLYHPRVAYLARDAQVEWVIVESGGGRVATHNETVLEGEGSSSQSYAVFLASHGQILDFQTRMQHFASHTTSDMDSKGILKDRARVTYTGLTNIRKYSHGCQSWQTEKTLMLSPECRADLIPALWIDDDDVSRAGHSAAAGQVNREHLYYLMSRGVSETDALLLLVNGFLTTIIQRIPLEDVREAIQALAEEKVRG